MSVPMRRDDPSYWMLEDAFTTTPVPGIYRESCYICRDPEFAQMGLPLCRKCPKCVAANEGVMFGHIPADDTVCSDCGYDELDAYLTEQGVS